MLKRALAQVPRPFLLEYRVNAGEIESNSWVHDPVQGGGRIIGEGCHAVDLVQFLTGAAPLRVFAQSLGGESDAARLQDNVSFQIEFADGSLATILYTSLGARSQPKERVEVFAGGTSGVIDNFKQTILYGTKIRKHAGINQDKGQAQMLNAFVEAVRTGGPAAIPLSELVYTSLTTFAVLDSMARKLPVEIEALESVQ
jgi:polar amino acid transport system substrate-binding protein